jgi:hypothetical protein
MLTQYSVSPQFLSETRCDARRMAIGLQRRHLQVRLPRLRLFLLLLLLLLGCALLRCRVVVACVWGGGGDNGVTRPSSTSASSVQKGL